MKYLSLLFSILLIASCKNSAPIPADLSGFVTEDIPGSAAVKVVSKDAGNNILEEGFILDGAKHGTWVTYHPDHKIKSMTNYIDGKRNGAHIELTNRGQIELLVNYKNDDYHGKYSKYKFGRPQEMTYIDGKLEGEIRIYFNSGGKLQKLITYKNGVQDGPLKFYDEEGNVTLEYVYKNGEKVSGGMVEKK